jgi:hypothetical protein
MCRRERADIRQAFVHSFIQLDHLQAVLARISDIPVLSVWILGCGIYSGVGCPSFSLLCVIIIIHCDLGSGW